MHDADDNDPKKFFVDGHSFSNFINLYNNVEDQANGWFYDEFGAFRLLHWVLHVEKRLAHRPQGMVLSDRGQRMSMGDDHQWCGDSHQHGYERV